MRIKTPVYLAFGTALCLYLAAAGRNGYSLMKTFSPPRLLPPQGGSNSSWQQPPAAAGTAAN